MYAIKHFRGRSRWPYLGIQLQTVQQVEQQKMNAGDLKQQLAVATAEGADHNQKAIQASALVDTLQSQVRFLWPAWLKGHNIAALYA